MYIYRYIYIICKNTLYIYTLYIQNTFYKVKCMSVGHPLGHVKPTHDHIFKRE